MFDTLKSEKKRKEISDRIVSVSPSFMFNISQRFLNTEFTEEILFNEHVRQIVVAHEVVLVILVVR